MVFTDDTEDALRAAVWLANSAEDPDTLVDIVDGDTVELDDLRALRSRLRAMLLAPRDEMAAHVNAALAEVRLTPRLVRHDELDWHLHGLADERPLAERVLVETAMALIDVIRTDEGSRLTVCEDGTCQAIALDLSRNRSKRYCSTSCANRNAVAAYRARRAAG